MLRSGWLPAWVSLTVAEYALIRAPSGSAAEAEEANASSASRASPRRTVTVARPRRFEPDSTTVVPSLLGVLFGVALLPLALLVFLLALLVLLFVRLRLLRVAGVGAGPGGRQGRGVAHRSVALVGGRAVRRDPFRREAAAGAGVVDLDRGAVVVLADQGVDGREVDVGAVGADPDQARAGEDAGEPEDVLQRGTGAGGDQPRLAFAVLVDVFGPVGVARDERVVAAEEGATVAGEEEPVLAPGDVEGRLFAVGPARGAEHPARVRVEQVHHRPFAAVVAGQVAVGDDPHVRAVGGHLHPRHRAAAAPAAEFVERADGFRFHRRHVAERAFAVAVEVRLPRFAIRLDQLLGGLEVDITDLRGAEGVGVGVAALARFELVVGEEVDQFDPATAAVPGDVAVVAVTAAFAVADRDQGQLVGLAGIPAVEVLAGVFVVGRQLRGGADVDRPQVGGRADVADLFPGSDFLGPLAVDADVHRPRHPFVAEVAFGHEDR